MSQADRTPPPETFRPWGWPATNAVALLALAAVVVFLFPVWQWLIFAPLWAYLVFQMVLSMAVELTVDDGELRWRTLVGGGAADVGLVATVEPGPRAGHGSIRIITIADGQRLWVGEGAEFDKLLRTLQRLVSDVEVRL